MEATRRRVVMGADPGKHGAVVLLDCDFCPGSLCAGLWTFPLTVKAGKVDVLSLYNDLMRFALKYDIVVVYSVMENVHAIFGSSAKGHFEFGDANGSLRACLQLFLANSTSRGLELTPPKEWQKTAWKCVTPIGEQRTDKDGNLVYLKSGEPRMDIDTKATSAAAAHAIFPSVSFVPQGSKKEHDGIVDAALMAYVAWCRAKSYKLC